MRKMAATMLVFHRDVSDDTMTSCDPSCVKRPHHGDYTPRERSKAFVRRRQIFIPEVKVPPAPTARTRCIFAIKRNSLTRMKAAQSRRAKRRG